ncbi:unnamed protein product, partial [Hapterophycus canaliculatus]
GGETLQQILSKKANYRAVGAKTGRGECAELKRGLVSWHPSMIKVFPACRPVRAVGSTRSRWIPSRTRLVALLAETVSPEMPTACWGLPRPTLGDVTAGVLTKND